MNSRIMIRNCCEQERGKMKRILAFALTVLMVIPLMTFAAYADAKVTADTSWYDAAKSEFTLTTAAQLYGLSSLSSGNNFSGKTIKLGADITVPPS